MLNDLSEFPEKALTGPGARYAIVASRWGRKIEHRQEAFRLLQRAILKAKADQATLLAAPGTAVYPWICHAAELFGVPVITLDIPHSECRDQTLVNRADRVFAIWVRQGGTIESLLNHRSRTRRDASVWVAVTNQVSCAGANLVQQGAIGWHTVIDERTTVPSTKLPPKEAKHSSPEIVSSDQIDWEPFLVHCTRERMGPFPGQSSSGWRDEVVLGGRAGLPASPLAVLKRILQDGWVRGSDRITKRGQAVTCWSAVPLPQLSQRRTYRSHLGRWDYEPFGIAIRRRIIESLGGRPVRYVECPSDYPAHTRWRIQASGKNKKWTQEQEWRTLGSVELSSCGPNELIVFVADHQDAGEIASYCRWPIAVMNTKTGPCGSSP